ncbi:2-oxoglutarate dehydrogenase complex dihydrolipoyllysine-residue succinyltransferase [Paenibacillus nasutitermitis]|uniref:Dihydrolipoyllysine-residue succinyltransferase component of 2-oxoglutarate dehydrogenase complex n=1 Tax=Paenibacillus nasutitermitis TaxID=1652958 RepID=A0A916YVH9_9BACL|nr:2-oxoglutarate dehydrogenase complex dihydrolipoyllysine-residue succinyltransferase [Paenibacillus nasutitermitis]GGD63059.1 dihydrolipoyllysine-residue succinyltransferase component of 2-oxoglutarate dehydrogenase complex [Paenibacillus nasutitermitis]
MSDIKIPEMGESIVEGTISKWHVKEGDQVGQGDVLAELETDKVNMEISAEQSGVVEKILRQEGETVSVGESIGVIGAGSGGAAKPAASAGGSGQENAPSQQKEEPAKAAAEATTAPESNKETAGDSSSYNASPAVRKLARERGIDLSRITPSDPLGRIREEDIKAYADGGQKPVASAPAAAAPSAPAASEPGKPVERRKMSRRRVTIANRLVEAQRTAAMLTTFNEVDMTAILDIRKRRKEDFHKKHDVGLGFMSFFTKAVVGALKAYPLLNAEIQGDEIVVKNYYDIGIAVSAKEGLVVPVVRQADTLSFAQIEKQIGSLAEKARSNSLALNDLQGGTFTITNGGVFGSLLSTPILNAPQVGILGMHKIQLRPVAIDEETTVNRPMMYVALSYDHRIVDGAEAVRFLVTLKQLLEDPESLLLEG